MNKLVSTKPDWARLSSEWERSELSQKEFCKKRGVSYTLFCHHRGALKKRHKLAVRQRSAHAEKAGQFIPVTVEVEELNAAPSSSTSLATPEVEVELPFGVVLRFRGVATR